MKKDMLQILFVEDEVDLCIVFKSYFGKRGFEVSTTDDGRLALDIIKKSRPDVVILDITIGKDNGVEILKELRRYDKDTKVIMMTGQRYSEDEIKKITSMGLSGYYEKPILLEEVEKFVLDVVGKLPGNETLSLKRASQQEVSGKIVHDVSNLVGIIMNQCENFSLGIEDGIYKTSPEVVERFSVLMNNLEETVERGKKISKELKEK